MEKRMNEYPLLTRKEVRKNKDIRRVQKNAKKRYRPIKGRFPKVRIDKVVELRTGESFVDLTGKTVKQNSSNNTSLEEFLKKVENNGLIGLSGDGFPTCEKIKTLLHAKVSEKYFIINGVECEPGLIHDEWLLTEKLEKVVSGVKALSEFISFHKVILATKKADIKEQEIFSLHMVPNRFPMGEEKILIAEILGMQLGRNQIPAEQGILVLNVQTVIALGEIFDGSYQAGARYITVSDFITGEAVVAKVKVGMNVIEILQMTLGKRINEKKYAGGGIMKGHEVGNEEVITLMTNFVAYGNSVVYANEAKCRKCGGCTRYCPVGVEVMQIVKGLEKDKNADVSAFHPEFCIGCGTCTYRCHAGKNTMQLVRQFIV